MGDRISISFSDGDTESVTLFSHWSGEGLRITAEEYLKELKQEIKQSKQNKKYLENRPLGRLEPETVMVDFIRYLTTHMERVTSDFYLGKDEHDGDNSDNGHHIIYVE